MLTEGERGRKEGKNIEGKKTGEGCTGEEERGTETEVEGDGKRRAHCSKSMETGRWMERGSRQKKRSWGMRKRDW